MEFIFSSAATVKSVLQQKTYLKIFLAAAILLNAVFYYGRMFRGKTPLEAALLLVISLLIGIVAALQVFSLKNNVLKYRQAGAGTFGTLIGVLTPLPLCCAPVTLELLGLAAASVYLSQYGLVLMSASVLLLAVSIVLASKNIIECKCNLGG